MNINLLLIDHCYEYELSDIIRMFFGKCDINIINIDKALDYNQGFLLSSKLKYSDKEIICESTIRYNDNNTSHTENMGKVKDTKLVKRLIKKSMYKLLSEYFNKEFPWGILTGIRPVKILHELIDNNYSKEDIYNILKEQFLMSDNRINLAFDIASIERKFIYPPDKRKISVYVGIPFCPSKCHYCSFTSEPVAKAGHFIDAYIDSLIKEISEISNILRDENIIVETIYIGGGTPTSLDDYNLGRIVNYVNERFNHGNVEFTCEAGRPDTITENKLQILKSAKVNRLSINPQTMNDDTLKGIGRAHNIKQIYDSFEKARKIGFKSINTDLIIGLPGENIDHVKNTMMRIQELAPENITLHTLSIKRASVYNEKYNSLSLPDSENVKHMMNYAKDYVNNMGMQPYYLYRQKFMADNMENIGYSLPNYECIYNMQIIEEKQSIIAFGADAMTKAVFLAENRIERHHNIKDYRLYIKNIDTMIKNKIDFIYNIFNS